MAQRFNLEAAISPSVDERAADREGEKIRSSFEEQLGDLDMDTNFDEFAGVDGGGGVAGAGGGGLPGGAGGAAAGAGALRGAAGAGSLGAAASAALPVALAGATAFAIKTGIERLAQTSPALEAQTRILSEAMDLFFRPVGDEVADTIAPGVEEMQEMAITFNQNSGEDGLAVAVGALTRDASGSIGEAIITRLEGMGGWDAIVPGDVGQTFNIALDFAEGLTGLEMPDFETLINPVDLAEFATGVDLREEVASVNLSDHVADVNLREFVTSVDLDDFVGGVSLSSYVSGVDLDDWVDGVDLGDRVTGIDLGNFVTGVNLGNFIDNPLDGDPGGPTPDPPSDPPDPPDRGGGGGDDDSGDREDRSPVDDGDDGGLAPGGPTGGFQPPSGVMATGGVARRPTTRTIGEAGPEAVMPLDDLTRTMSRSIRQALAGADTGSSQEVVRAIEQLQREMRATRQAIDSLDLTVMEPRDSTDPFNP